MLDSKSNHVIFLVTCDAAGVASDSPRLGSPLPAERPRDPANPGSLVGRVRAAGAGNEPSHMQSTAAETRQKRSWPGLCRMLPRLARHAMHATRLILWPAGRRRPSPTKRPSALGENLLGIRAAATSVHRPAASASFAAAAAEAATYSRRARSASASAAAHRRAASAEQAAREGNGGWIGGGRGGEGGRGRGRE